MKRSLFTLFILALVCLVLPPGEAAAQNPPGLVVDPNWVEFDVPPSHSAIHHYELGWFLLGAVTDPVQTADIGTGTPTGIRLKLALPQSYPIGKVYVAKVRGVTVDGTVTLAAEWSEISNPFGKGPDKILGSPAVVK
jgi:hypothetical protein